MATNPITSNYPVQCFGNLIADASNASGFGGSVLITNSSNSNKKNTSASLAFIVASAIDISGNTYTGGYGNVYGNSQGYDSLGINSGGFQGTIDRSDVRITAVIDTESGASVTGVACTFSVSKNITNPPTEAMRIASSGNVGIGNVTPQSTLDVSGTVNIFNAGGNGIVKLQGNSLNNIGVGTGLLSAATGSNNTSFGIASLNLISSGTSNTSIGYQSLTNITTQNYNTAVGDQALKGAVSHNNTAVGYNALSSFNGLASTINGNNTAIGSSSLSGLTSGINNTAIGYSAGSSITKFGNTTCIGAFSQPLSGNQIVLGTRNEFVYVPDQLCIGNVNVGNGIINSVNALDISGSVYASGSITGLSFNATSDYRMKNNIKILSKSKSIDILNPVEYDLSGGLHDMGFLAHEVQEIFPFLVSGVKDGPKMQSLNYNGFIALLVKEIKDIKKRLADTEKTVRQLTNKSV